MQLIVLGCGVSGLSSGIRLLEAGYQVTIWARDLPPNTTSNVAAALWYPYKAYPEDRVTGWGQRAFAVFSKLAELPQTGVFFRTGTELFDAPVPDPWWRDCVRNFRRAAPEELPKGFTDGYIFETPVIEMDVYLEYLRERFARLGGLILQREVHSLQEALASSPIVVNCTGLGSRELVGDTALFPIRGQIVRVAPPPVGHFILDEDHHERRGVSYIVPRSNDCVLGGTAEVDSWSLEPNPTTAQAIIERCARLAPAVSQAAVRAHVVGLRPGRAAVRLEAQAADNAGLVVHNYGHGGAGVTLSWGCAEEVVDLVVQNHTLR